ncbi:hypothetical protein DL93DRAFT_999230 [Clavulina sp. PMI_390]|nr:hypothetical protein DL93DRAFT_999230 [Clavulina sp. PMI_390]
MRLKHAKGPFSSSLGPSNGLSTSVTSRLSTPLQFTSSAIELSSVRNRSGLSILRSRLPDNASDVAHPHLIVIAFRQESFRSPCSRGTHSRAFDHFWAPSFHGISPSRLWSSAVHTRSVCSAPETCIFDVPYIILSL